MPYFSNKLNSFVFFLLLVISNILSCDSEIIISLSPMSFCFKCIFDNSISNPFFRLSAVSDRQHDNPPPPRSFMALTHFFSMASRVHSCRIFSKNGSGIWTAERFSSSRFDEAKDAPLIPSLPVEFPAKIMMSPFFTLFLTRLFNFP